MDNQQFYNDDSISSLPMPEYLNNPDFSTWNVGKATSSSQQDYGTLGEISADDREMFLPAISASSSPLLSQHFLIREQGLEDAGREDGLRQYFYSTDEDYTGTNCVDHVIDHSVSGSKGLVTNTSRYDDVASLVPLIPLSSSATVVRELCLRLKRIEEYNPASGLWEVSHTEILPFSVNGSTYQNVYYKDSENREFRCCIDHAQGAPRVVMFDVKKQTWVQGCIHRPIPFVRASTDAMVSRLHVTTHILGCGGFIFVYSEQEIGEDVFSCVHKLNPDCFGEAGMWEEIWVELRSTEPDDLQVYPEFTGVQVLGASLLQCGGAALVFSEQASGDSEAIICVQRRKRVWEPVLLRIISKKKRHRGPNWTPEEITAFLEAKVEALEAVPVGKPDWDFISERLEQRGFNRGPQACEDQWGTRLNRLTEIKNYVQVHNITPGGTSSSSWDDLWNMSEGERSANKLPRVFPLHWYKMMEKIHEKKPWKSKTGLTAGSNQRSTASTSHLNSTVTSCNSSGFNFSLGASSQLTDEDQSRIDVTTQVSSLCDYLLQGRQNLTNNQIARTKDEALETVKLQLQLELVRQRNAENRPQQATRRRPRKSRKKDVNG